eukprot:3643554-Pleurochrysis_carterae.AAC.2
MDELSNLQHLSLVSKVCKELDNHLGISDKTLAEFIIDLAKQNPELSAFRKALDENGAEFPASFASSLLSLINRMAPKKKASDPGRSTKEPGASGPSQRYPGLAVPNDSDERRKQLEREALGEEAFADPGNTWKKMSRDGSSMRPPPPPPGGPGAGPSAHSIPGRDAPDDDRAVPGKIYAGRVSNVMDFGCFVQLDGVRGKAEGLVHVSLIQNGALRTPHDAVKRGQPCFVKVLSTTGSKISLSMKDADQKTGADLSPNMRLPGSASAPGSSSNPTRDVSESERRRRQEMDDDKAASRPLKRLTSPEKFEAKQLIASGVLDVRDYPQFDETVGLLNVEETEEELEIELNVRCAYLRPFPLTLMAWDMSSVSLRGPRGSRLPLMCVGLCLCVGFVGWCVYASVLGYVCMYVRVHVRAGFVRLWLGSRRCDRACDRRTPPSVSHAHSFASLATRSPCRSFQESEPLFLRGQTKNSVAMSPIKVRAQHSRNFLPHTHAHVHTHARTHARTANKRAHPRLRARVYVRTRARTHAHSEARAHARTCTPMHMRTREHEHSRSRVRGNAHAHTTWSAG